MILDEQELREQAKAAGLANALIALLPDYCESKDLDIVDVSMFLCGFLAYRLCGEEECAFDEETFFKNIKAAISAGRMHARMPETTDTPQ